MAVLAIVQAPPGDFLTAYAATLASSDTSISAEHLEALRRQYGQPIHVQYLKWMRNLLRGNLGLSLEYQRPNRVRCHLADELALEGAGAVGW